MKRIKTIKLVYWTDREEDGDVFYYSLPWKHDWECKDGKFIWTVRVPETDLDKLSNWFKEHNLVLGINYHKVNL